MQLTQNNYEEHCDDNDEEHQLILSDRNPEPKEQKLDVYSTDEPKTHQKNFPFFLKLFLACWGDRKNTLTRSQISSFNKLKRNSNILFNASCKDYDDLLQDLFEIFTGEHIDEIVNDRWKDFGFQNSNPRSDFRAGGLLALKQLTSFAENNSKKIENMIVGSNEYLLAVSSIGITYFLKLYYHLSNSSDTKGFEKILCSRTAFKSFCNLLEDDGQVLNKIHEMLLIDLFNVWQDIKKRIPAANLLDFGLAESLVKERFRKTTQGTHFITFEALKANYFSVEVRIPDKTPRMQMSKL